MLEENKLEEQVKNEDVKENIEDIETKFLAKQRVRGLLIGINVVLAAYLLFEIGSLIYEKVSLSIHDENYINLYGTSKRDSQTLYDTYLLKDEEGNYVVEELYDYGIYGDYLHLSKNAITPGSYSSIENTYIRRVKYFDEVHVDFDSKNNVLFNEYYLDGGLRLSSLDEGEYLLLDAYIMETNYDEKHRAFKIRSEEMIYQTIYTLPDNNGMRRKIDVKSIDSSPSLVISVTDVDELPSGYYDFVFIGEGFEEYSATIDNKYKVYHASSLLDAYKAQSTYCFVLDDTQDEVLASNYINSPLIKRGNLFGGTSSIALQDKNDYIRELGGYLLGAGSCIGPESESSFIVKPYQGKNAGYAYGDFGFCSTCLAGQYPL